MDLSKYKIVDIDSIECDIYDEKDVYAMILYSHNGDILLKYYTKNNYIVNDELEKYFKNVYLESLEKYKIYFYPYELKRGFINLYVDNLYLQLSKAFKQSFDYDTLWFRGLKTKLNIKKDETLVINQFWSTTNNIKIAKTFGSYIIYILCPKNVKLCTVYCHSKYKSESEILFPDRSIFKCLHQDNNTYYLLFMGIEYNEHNTQEAIKLYDFSDEEIEMYKKYISYVKENNIEDIKHLINITKGQILNYRLTNNLIYLIENNNLTLLDIFVKELNIYKIDLPIDFYEIYNNVIERKPKEKEIMKNIINIEHAKSYSKLKKFYL